MKLSVSCLFALAQSAPEKKGGLEPRTSLVPCPYMDFDGDSVIYWNEYTWKGDVTFQEYKDNEYCYVEIGTECETGVEAEFQYVQLESPTSKECKFDWVRFTYTDENGRSRVTNTVCGCYASNGNSFACDLNYLSYWQSMEQMSPMAQTSKYVMEGSNHRVILKSDSSQSGGKISLDWYCLPDPTTTTTMPITTTMITTTTTTPPPITNVADMAQARLTGRFKPSAALNYGCAGRGYFDPFDRTIGKQVDETDKAFYSWKKCVQCALSDDGVTPLIKPDGGIPAYHYDERTDSCGMLIFMLNVTNLKLAGSTSTGRQVCECDKTLIDVLLNADNTNANYNANDCEAGKKVITVPFA